jgi:hypothetical protein
VPACGCARNWSPLGYWLRDKYRQTQWRFQHNFIFLYTMGCSPSRLGLSSHQGEGNDRMPLDSANRSRTPPISSGSSHPRNAPEPSIHDSDCAKIGQRCPTSSRYPATSLLVEGFQSAPPVIQINFEDVSSHPGGLGRPWHPGSHPDPIVG